MAKADKELKTIEYYDRQASQWSSAHGGGETESYWKTEMEKFHRFLPSGKVIEIGSGAGKDAAALIQMGYEYTGTDASKGLIVVAKKRNPGAVFVNQAVDELAFPKEFFDGFWTAATLLHIPKNRIDVALKSIKNVVKQGGIGFISMKSGAGERTDPETGRWFSYYSQKEFKEVLERNGFNIIDQETRKGEKDWWIVYYITKKIK